MVAERDRETVVVEGDRRPSYGWLIALGVVLLLLILFFANGGMNMFNGTGGGTNSGTSNTVQVQPTTQQ